MAVHNAKTGRPVHMANSVNTSFVPVSSCGQWRKGNNPASSPHPHCAVGMKGKDKEYNTTAFLALFCCVEQWRETTRHMPKSIHLYQMWQQTRDTTQLPLFRSYRALMLYGKVKGKVKGNNAASFLQSLHVPQSIHLYLCYPILDTRISSVCSFFLPSVTLRGPPWILKRAGLESYGRMESS